MLRLTTLGGIDLRDGLGRPVRDVLSQPKRIALLVHLALESRRGPVQRDRVLAMFWPEADEARARNALSQALYHLRQALGADVIEGRGNALSITADRLWCDAVVLEDALSAGDADLALDLYTGAFCPGLFVSGAADVEEWIAVTRREQRRRLLDAARLGVRRQSDAGAHPAAARLARRALTLVPDDEADVREYLAALERAGDVAAALALYGEYTRRLAAELETEPAPETAALITAMKQRRSEAAGAASAASAAADVQGMRSVPGSATDVAPAASAAAAAADDAEARPSASHATAAARSGTPPRGAPRRLLLLTGVAAVSLLVWSVTARARLSIAADGPSTAPTAVAVFPFTGRGGEAAGELGTGMADLLAAKLDGTEAARAIDPRTSVIAAEGRAPDPVRGDQLSRTLDARYFVLGTVAERAGHLQLDGALYETGRPRRAVTTATVSGDTAALFQLVDDLAGQLLASLVAGRDTTLTKLAAVTTSSLPALKAYLRGERALRDGRDAQAAAAFREATSLDSTFALAWYRLAFVANWVSVPGVDDPAVVAAIAARNDRHLSPLGRDLLEAYRAYKEPSDAALPRYRALTQAYPDNVEAWYMLGESIFHYGPLSGLDIDESRAAFERTLALQPNHVHAMLHIARLAARAGRPDEIEALTTRLRSQHLDADRLLEMRALLAWTRGDSVAAAAIRAQARTADELVVWGLVSGAANYALDPFAAHAIARDALPRLRSSLMRPYATTMLGQTDLAAGRWRLPDTRRTERADARARVEAQAFAASEPFFPLPDAQVRALRERIAGDVPYQPIAAVGRPLSAATGHAVRHHLLGLLDLRLGDTASARAQHDSLRRFLVGADSMRVVALEVSLRSQVLRTAGRHAEALETLERYPFDILNPRLALAGGRERFARAELLRALGRDAEALRWYRTFPAFYDLQFAAPAALRAAQIAERAGDRAGAQRSYSLAVRYWRAADPEFAPLLREAREGLARTR